MIPVNRLGRATRSARTLSRIRPTLQTFLAVEELESRIVPALNINLANLVPATATNGTLSGPIKVALFGSDLTAGHEVYYDFTNSSFEPTTTGSAYDLPTFDFPSANPMLTVTNHLNNARLYFSVGGSVQLPVNAAGDVTVPAPTIVSPINDSLYYDFVEFTYEPGQPTFLNTSQVDAFGIPIVITMLEPADITTDKVGVIASQSSVLSAFNTFLTGNAAAIAAFGDLATLQAPYRIIAPNDRLNMANPPVALTTYFDDYVNEFFELYDREINPGATLKMANVPGNGGTGVPPTSIHQLEGFTTVIQHTDYLGNTWNYRVLQMTDVSSGSSSAGDVYNVFAPYFSTNGFDDQTTNGTGNSGEKTITVTDATGIVSGMNVSGTGIGTDAVVVKVQGLNIQVNVANSAAVSGSLTFKAPAPPADSIVSLPATGTSGTPTLTVTGSTAGIVAGMLVSGSGIDDPLLVDSVSGSTVTLKNNLTNNVNGTVVFANSYLANLTERPTQMVFGGDGVFADNGNATRGGQFRNDNDRSVLLGAIENQIDSALTRGVATNPYGDWMYDRTQQFNYPAVGNQGEDTIVVQLGAGVDLNPALIVGIGVSGPGIAPGAVVTDIAGATITLSLPNTGPVTAATNLIFSYSQPPPFYNKNNPNNPNRVWNYYSAFFHQTTINYDGLAYGFAFDDQGHYSSQIVSPTAATSVTITVGTPQLIVPGPEIPQPLFVTGADAGGAPQVKVFNADGSVRFNFLAYDPGFTGGVRVATGDVNRDGIEDIITGAGPGGGPHVKVFDGETGAEIRSFFAYDASFTGGVYVGAGDTNDDGYADIITGAGSGGGPHVKVFSGIDNAVLHSFFAYDPGYSGGVTVAGGDVNRDDSDDIITGSATGSTHVKVFNGMDVAVLQSFFAFQGFFGGVYVGAGDTNDDGYTDIITGAGPSGGPHVKVFSGIGNALLQNFYAYEADFTGGVRVSGADFERDGRSEIFSGAGPAGELDAICSTA